MANDKYTSMYSGEEINEFLKSIDEASYLPHVLEGNTYSQEDIFENTNLLYRNNGAVYLVLSTKQLEDNKYLITILQNDEVKKLELSKQEDEQ